MLLLDWHASEHEPCCKGGCLRRACRCVSTRCAGFCHSRNCQPWRPTRWRACTADPAALVGSQVSPGPGQPHRFNFWGYSTVAYFAPMSRYSQASADGRGGQAVVDEFKAMVKACHQRGIEVFMDVVFNHTAEGNEQGPSLSFRWARAQEGPRLSCTAPWAA